MKWIDCLYVLPLIQRFSELAAILKFLSALNDLVDQVQLIANQVQLFFKVRLIWIFLKSAFEDLCASIQIRLCREPLFHSLQVFSSLLPLSRGGVRLETEEKPVRWITLENLVANLKAFRHAIA